MIYFFCYDPNTSHRWSFLDAFQALKKSEREAFIVKLLQDEKLAEDLRYAAIVEARKDESSISLDDYLTRRKS